MWAASLLSLLLLFAPAGSSTGHQQPHRGGADGDAAAVVLPGRRDIPTAVEPVRSRQLQQQLQLVGEQPHGRKLLAGRGHSVEDGQLQRPPEHAYVALCAIVRNENDYIREWIDYHHFIGVDKFYVFDHMSSPPVAVVLEDHVKAGLVEIFYFSDSWQYDKDFYRSSARSFLSPQGWAYDNCFKWFSFRHEFMAPLDVDEFIFLRGTLPGSRPSLPNFLKLYEGFGGVTVHWQLYGPSGREARPKAHGGSTLAGYTQCMERPSLQKWDEFDKNPVGYTKSITHAKHWRGGCDPHRCSVAKPYVNEDFQQMSGPVIRAVHWSKIRVAHFITRSRAEYAAKMERGSGHSQFSDAARRRGIRNRGWKFFDAINKSAHDECKQGVWLFNQMVAAGWGDFKKVAHEGLVGVPEEAASAAAAVSGGGWVAAAAGGVGQG